MSYGIKAYDEQGLEQLFSYYPRNIVQVQDVDVFKNPRGRIYPYGAYSGSFQWIVSNYPDVSPGNICQVTRHSDGSIEWYPVSSKQRDEGGTYFTIMGVVDRDGTSPSVAGLGALLTNTAGDAIQYGAEAIPCCLAAGLATAGINGYVTVVTSLAYQSDVSVFIRMLSSTFSTSGYAQGPLYSLYNSSGRLAIRFECDLDFFNAGAYQLRYYVVGRTPNTKPSTGAYGMLIYDSSGRIAFSTEYPIAPLNRITRHSDGRYPYLGTKAANILTLGYSWYMGADLDFDHLYGFRSPFVWADGVVREALTTQKTNTAAPGAGWNSYSRGHVLMSMDTTYADRHYFGD